MKKQDFQQFRDIQQIEAQRVKLIIPAFLLAPNTWAGASTVLASIPLNNTAYLSLKMPIDLFGANFVPAIRWYDGVLAKRFKLWENDGELLYYPVYDGERIGPNAVIEIWSVNTTSAPENDSAVTLESSQFVFPPNPCASCCAQPDQETLLSLVVPTGLDPYTYCNPFCLTLLP